MILCYKGKEVPKSWQGALDISYKLGDGGLMSNSTVKIQVNVPNKRQNVYNVIGTVYGKEEPDRWVLIGNHRDAWGFGAVDASSGTSAMMEISRGVGELLKKGEFINLDESTNRHANAIHLYVTYIFK